MRNESADRLDILAEFMKVKKSAHVEISGHTDNVGKPKANKALSQKRAQACRAYIISKGIDRDRAVDEDGNQLAVFGRRGARPFNGEEYQP